MMASFNNISLLEISYLILSYTKVVQFFPSTEIALKGLKGAGQPEGRVQGVKYYVLNRITVWV